MKSSTVYTSVIVCCIIALAASEEQCRVSSTTDQFVAYVRTFPSCHASSDMTVFQDEIQIINQVFDFDGNFNSNGFLRDTLAGYCSRVQGCKTQVSACESRLNDFVESAGTALCQNGQAMTQAIDNALNTLSNNPCELFAEPTGLPSDGCHLSSDNAAPTTYLEQVMRENKKNAAISRCMSRYSETQGRCSGDVIAALATITAASQPLENIERSFDSVSNYGKPSLSTDHNTMSVRGFMHFYKNNEKVESCTQLRTSNVLLWNTYLRVDGTGTELIPTSGRSFLSSVFIQFSDDAGRLLDSYSASNGLATQTLRQQAGQATEIQVESIGSDLVVLSHNSINTKIAVSSQGQGLSVVVSMPTSLIDLETLGLMVEGCAIYDGSVVRDLDGQATSECKTDCSSESYDVDTAYYSECAYDCTHGIKSFTTTYTGIDEQLNSVQSSAVYISVSTLLCILSQFYLMS